MSSVPGTFVYTPAAGFIPNPGPEPDSIVDLHARRQRRLYVGHGDDQRSTSRTRAPIITWDSPADITYGTPLSMMQLDATASVPGTFAYSANSGVILNAGQGETLRVSFTPTDLIDYPIVTASTTINVEKATPTIHLSDPGGSYNGSPFPASVTIAGSGNDDQPAASLGGVAPTLTYYDGSGIYGTSPRSHASRCRSGTYTVVASFSGTADYLAVHSAPVTFTIKAGFSTIALTSSTSSSFYGQSITFVAEGIRRHLTERNGHIP